MPTITLSEELLQRLQPLSDKHGGSHEQAIDELLTKAEWLEALIDDVAIGVVLQGPNAEVLLSNQAALDLLGLTKDQLLGKTSFDPDWNVIHEDGSPFPGETHPVPQAIGTRQPLRGVVMGVYRPQHQDRVWLSVSAVPRLDMDGQVRQVVCSFDDITARKKAEWALAEINHTLEERVQQRTEELRQERDLLARIMETSPAGITVVDRNGRITFSNKRSEEIQGAPREETANRTYDSPAWRHTDYDGGPWPDEKQPFTQVMTTGQPVYDVRHAIEWDNGQRVYLAINGAPLFDENGEIAKVVFTIEDYTQRKLQQDELEQALARERELNEMRSRFLSTVSHEFRTPLSIMMTSTGILRMHHRTMTDEQFASRLDRIDAQIKRLAGLLDDVTFMNKSEQVGHPVRIGEIRLGDFFRQLITETQIVYGQSVKILLSGTPQTIYQDETLLHQICSNLLSNAVKYSRAGDEVWVRYHCTERTLEIEVKDHGIGIPEKDQESIFDLFHRSTNVGMVSGTGLGLAITRQSVALLGGSISFTSAEGVGTTFSVSIPLAAAPDQ